MSLLRGVHHSGRNRGKEMAGLVVDRIWPRPLRSLLFYDRNILIPGDKR